MKHNRNPLAAAIRYALGAGLVAGLAMTSSTVFAESEEAAETTDRIQVTGSRIMRADGDTPSPVLRFTREDLQATGANTVQDFVRQLTIATSQNFDTFTNSFANATSSINLRGLGNQATLVLLNGRRIAPYGRGQNIREGFVDLNSIPFAAIERIEVLKDGASAIYGSDAIAGVVNIIMREDFEGAEIQVDYQDTWRGDSSETGVSAVFGSVSADTSITSSFSFLKRDALFLRDRGFSRVADRQPFGGVEERSVFAAPGTLVDPATGAYTVEGTGCFDDPTGRNRVQDFGPAIGQLCRYNYSEFINFYPESEQFSNNTFIRHNLNNAHSLFSEFSYTRRSATNIAAPAPFTAHDELSLQLLRGADALGFISAPLLGNAGLFFPGASPFNPFGVDTTLVHRPVAQGPRTEETTSDTLRVVAGLEGMFGADWNYQAAVHYSRSQVLTENRNAVLRRDLQGLLMGSFVDGLGNTLWYNPFGRNDPAVVDRLQSIVAERDRSVDQGFSFETSGPIFELPAGELGLAVGGEYREMTLQNEASIDRNRGQLVGTGGSSDSRGERDMRALFAELGVPVTSMLELQLALRWEDYSDFGDTTNPKVGIRFQPIDDLVLRATWGESFRAPSLFELFNGSVTSFPSFVDTIRCPDGPTGENFATTTDVDCGGGQFRVESGGNPFLQPETSEAYNVGLVWNPSFVDGLTVAVDFWRYETQDIVTSVPLSILVGNNDPSVVVRAPRSASDIAAGVPAGGGPIDFVNNSFINANSQKTDGIDLDVIYRWSTRSLGAFAVGVQGTYYNSYELSRLVPEAGVPEGVIQTDDGIGSVIFGTRPEWIASASLNWSYGDHGMNLFVRHRDKVASTLADTRTGDDFTVASHTTFDLQYEYQLSQELGFAVGCINCLDRNPPNYNDDFAGFLADADDPRGARLYGRVTYRF